MWTTAFRRGLPRCCAHNPQAAHVARKTGSYTGCSNAHGVKSMHCFMLERRCYTTGIHQSSSCLRLIQPTQQVLAHFETGTGSRREAGIAV